MCADRKRPRPPVVDTTSPPINAPQILSPAEIARGIFDETRSYLSPKDAETLQHALISPQIAQQAQPKPTLIDVLSELVDKSSLLMYLSPTSQQSLADTSLEVERLVFGREAMVDEIHRVHQCASSYVGALYRESVSKTKLPPKTRHFMIESYLDPDNADGRMFRVLWGLWNLVFPIFNSNDNSEAGQAAQVEWLREFLEHNRLPEMMNEWRMANTHTYRWLLHWIAVRHDRDIDRERSTGLPARVHSLLVTTFGQTDPSVELEDDIGLMEDDVELDGWILPSS
jgi:hypothetical protein